MRSDSAGATHGLLGYCREASVRFSVGYELTERVRAAILQTDDDAWIPALDRDGSARTKGEVCEITDMVDLSAWPQGTRLIVRRERPHLGAQLSFTDHDRYRFQAVLTDQTDENIAVLECRHRQHAHVEDRIRDDKDTGPCEVPVQRVRAQRGVVGDRRTRARAARLDPSARPRRGLAKAEPEPKELRYRLLHVAGRLAFSGRRAKLHLQHTWPWAGELLAAFKKLKTVQATTC